MAIIAPVSSSFCVPHETQLVVKKKVTSFLDPSEYTVTDGEGSLLFKMEKQGGFFSFSRRIHDATSGTVVLSLKYYRNSWFSKDWWKAYRGDSESESQLVFTLKRKSSSWWSSHISFEVLLPEDNDSSTADFSIEAKSWRSDYSILFYGTSIAEGSDYSILFYGTSIAEAKRTDRGMWRGMSYSVKVYPGVDRAFIAALTLLWILERHIHEHSTS